MLRWLWSSAVAVAVVAAGCFASSAAIAAPPTNDDFTARQLLGPALPIELTANNSEATLEAGEPSHAGFVPAGHSIWFQWEPTDTELVTIGTCGSEPATILTLYTGNALGSLSEVASGRYSGPNCDSFGAEITFKAVAGIKYQLQVDGGAYHLSGEPAPIGEGEIELQIRSQGVPPNNDFADAKTLTGTATPTTVDAGNWGATKELGEPDHRGKGGGSSIWFKWTAPRTNGAFLQACNGPIPSKTVLAVYTGTSVDALSPVAPIDAEPDCRYAFAAIAGVTYRIAIDGKPSALTGAGAMSDPGLLLSMFPGNDDFETPVQLQGSNFLAIRYGNVAATKQQGEPDHAGNQGGASVWFTWTAPITGSAHFSACEASFRTLVAIYEGSSLHSLRPVASSDNPASPSCLLGNGPGEVAFNIDVGVVYRIAVDGFAGATGGFNIEMNTSNERLPTILPGVRPTAPNTRIAKRNIRRARGVARFVLAASEPGATFICKLDSRRFTPCDQTVRYRNLRPGWHVFKSKAVDDAGLVDPSPAVFRFKVQRLD